ncbi:hypothetical protein [Halobacterium wangiae]|uniref:hypothetical protein n=1 Tax=Halobacterium wangiae TaxID=2902623 RepID=UPI001E5A5920|nr:hypothetical protein [Halobacterium wangiae]
MLFEPITGIIEEYANDLLDVVVSTPRPDTVLGAPGNEPWPELHAYYWDAIIPISLLVWALSVGLVIMLEATGHLFSGYHQTRLKKRVFAGLLGILSWWWLAAFSLRFVSALTGILLPDLSSVTLFETLSFSGMGVLGLAISLTVDFVLFALIAVIYFVRRVTLYLFVLMMPLLIALWVPGVGPFALVSRFMTRLAGFYIPFLFMTLPIALLFRLGGILGGSFSLSMGGIGAWLTALVIPLVAVLSPFVLVWQASALFFVGGRMAQHTSRQTAGRRVDGARTLGATTHRGVRNARAGVRGEPAVGGSGQYLLDSSQSRAHSFGSAVSESSSSLRDSLRGSASRARGGSSGSSSGDGQAEISFPAMDARRDPAQTRRSRAESESGSEHDAGGRNT